MFTEEQRQRLLQRFAKKMQAGIKKAQAINSRPLPKSIVPMFNILKPGKAGNADISFYRVTETGAAVHTMSQAASGRPEMAIKPGIYSMLKVDGELMMTDTPHEIRTNLDLIENARGDVLIAGLGLGMVLVPLLLNRKVKSVTVIEKSKGVIKLVKPRIQKWRDHQGIIGAKPAPLYIINADIFEWDPGELSWDTIYFDIWPTIGMKNLEGGNKLKRKFKKNLRNRGWMAVWVEKEIRAYNRQDARELALLKKNMKKMKEERAAS